MNRMDELRIPPHSVEAEQAILGGLMLSPAALVKISDWLPEEAFFRQDHRAIYRAVCELAQRGEPCDAVTMGDWFVAQNMTALVGGVSYVLELASVTPGAANIVAHAEIVREKYALRMAVLAGETLACSAMSGKAPAAEIIAVAQDELRKLEATKLRGNLQQSKPLVRAWYMDLVERYDQGKQVTGMATPWHDLNKITHGLQDGDLILLPARPNMGKSVLAFNMAAFTALRGGKVAMFSLEMTAKQVTRRCVSSLAEVPYDWLIAPHETPSSESYWPRISKWMLELQKAPLFIDDTPSLTIEQIRARALRSHMQAPIRLVVVDHLHIVRRPGRNEVSELGDITRGLKALAKELGCPVIALAQLNRALEQRPDKHPMMSDLRSSGELEQDADLIVFVYREDYYNPSTHLKNVIELDIGKGRDLKTGQRLHLLNEYHFMRARDWEGDLPEPPKATTESKAKETGFTRKAPKPDFRENDK